MVYEMRIGCTSTVGGAAMWADLGDDLPVVAEEVVGSLPRITLRRNSTGCGGSCSVLFILLDIASRVTKLQTSH